MCDVLGGGSSYLKDRTFRSMRHVRGGVQVRSSVRCVLFCVITLLSMLGEGMALFALTLESADQLGSWGVTALFLIGLVPPILAAPAIGRWVDGAALFRVWILNLCVHIGIFAVMAIFANILLSLALMSVASVCAVINGAVVFKIIPRIRGGFTLARASSFLVVATSLAGIIAPALASIAHAKAGVGAVLWCAAAGFLGLAMAAVVLSRSLAADGQDERPRPDHVPEGAIADRGVVLTGNPRLRILLLPVAAIVLFTAAEGVAGVFYLREITDSDTGYAVLLGAWSVGAVLGSLLGGNRRFGARSSLPILLGGGLVGAAILIEGLWANAVGLAMVFLAGGLGNGLHNTGVRTAIYEHVPESRHGAAWAQLRMLINIMVALGYLTGTPGLLVGPARTIIVISGAATLLVIVLSAVLLGGSAQAGVHGQRAVAESEG